MNEVFPLSDKYLDFLNYECSAEFLEGTTFAGKTTVAIPKFMFKVAINTSKKPSIIAGLDLGTIEKNIINSDNGLIDVFGDYSEGGLIEYNPNGAGKIRLPHILYHTENGIKVIYVLGYDNKARWKKALGGQCYGLFIDEFNIADMEFVREAFMRADYRLCTLNPDDPNKECYTQYVNHARPLEKYKNDAPIELLKMISLEHIEDWTWWYFTFDHNLSLTIEKKQQIINSVPRGTKLFKNKILGLRGKATGLVFNVTENRIITEKQAMFEDWQEKEPKKKRKYLSFSIGCDTSYSRKSHDKLTFEFIGITADNKCILLEEESYNNKPLEQLKDTRSRELLYSRNYAKAMDEEDFLEIAISSSLYEDVKIEEEQYLQMAKKYHLELQRLAGKKVVDSLNLYQYDYNSALVGGSNVKK